MEKQGNFGDTGRKRSSPFWSFLLAKDRESHHHDICGGNYCHSDNTLLKYYNNKPGSKPEVYITCQDLSLLLTIFWESPKQNY